MSEKKHTFDEIEIAILNFISNKETLSSKEIEKIQKYIFNDKKYYEFFVEQSKIFALKDLPDSYSIQKENFKKGKDPKRSHAQETSLTTLLIENKNYKISVFYSQNEKLLLEFKLSKLTFHKIVIKDLATNEIYFFKSTDDSSIQTFSIPYVSLIIEIDFFPIFLIK